MTSTQLLFYSDRTTLVTDNAGAKVGQALFDPYGGVITNTIPATLTDRLFTGQRFDPGTGLYDYRARFYDPLTGSFIQPDSIIPDPLNPASWNRFSYVYGNPVNYTDPSGHFAIGPWDVVDIGSFLWSASDFYNEPTWANAGWLALDTVGLLPLLPGAGTVRRAGQLALADEAVDTARWTDNVGDSGQTVRQTDRVGEVSKVGASCSFSSNTLVVTAEGRQAISTLAEDDIVLAYNEATGELGWYPVTAVWAHVDPVIVYLTIDGEVIETTPNHPFFTSEEKWVFAGLLQEGDQIQKADGSYGVRLRRPIPILWGWVSGWYIIRDAMNLSLEMSIQDMALIRLHLKVA